MRDAAAARPEGFFIRRAPADRVGTAHPSQRGRPEDTPAISTLENRAPAPDPTSLDRQVFYLPGFDPRAPETYWGLFRRESRITAGRRGLAITVSDPARSQDGLSLDWDVANGPTRTRYSLLRWDEIVRDRFPLSNGRRLRDVPVLWWRLWRSGYLKRFRKEARRFAAVILGVHIFYLVFALASVAVAAFAVSLVPAPSWLQVLAVPPLAYGLLAAIMRLTLGKPLYIAHLVDDTTFTHAHAAGEEPRMGPRLDAFAERIRAAEGQAREIVVIGHSSSSFLGIEVLDRLLARDPGFGTRGTPISFVSIGSVIPWLGLDPRAESFRGALSRFAAATNIGWLDVRADWDWLSIHLRNPLVACGLPYPGHGRPATIRVRVSELIEPELLRRRKWNLFHLHFQLLMSSRAAHAFDYVAFVTGPEPVHEIVARCRDAAPPEPKDGAPDLRFEPSAMSPAQDVVLR